MAAVSASFDMLRCVLISLLLAGGVLRVAAQPSPAPLLPGLDGPMRGFKLRKLASRSDTPAKEEDKKDDDKPFADLVKGLEAMTHVLFTV